ncbi:nucleotidyltransferase [Candidatus Poribacteria bacterium]|nr:nucleotidyltransferase [Candidatus Poribacteria bacterium]MYA58196.1 nucleotidyltransferase [Candidatus Poribacteria bacterium]
MKHIPYFQKFLSEEVDLNQTRLQRLVNSSSAVDTFLRANLEAYEKTERQGSYGLKTIIKPVGTREFDADMLLYMTYDKDKEPKDYINDVYNCLRANDNYKDKVHRRTRCVYIDYADEFHLDLVPCITQGEEYFICNNKENEFEITDGTGYRDWFNEKTRITNGNLKRDTRLLKFLRDHKGNFSVKSILLTTLIGNSVYTSDEGSDDFKDIPTSLKTVSNRINSFLQANVLMPEICNPVLEGESFTRHWDQDKYSHFREMFDLYNSKINEAFDATEHNASVRKWRELFGDNFGELKKDTQNNGSPPAVVTSAPVVVTPTKPYAR